MKSELREAPWLKVGGINENGTVSSLQQKRKTVIAIPHVHGCSSVAQVDITLKICQFLKNKFVESNNTIFKGAFLFGIDYIFFLFFLRRIFCHDKVAGNQQNLHLNARVSSASSLPLHMLPNPGESCIKTRYLCSERSSLPTHYMVSDGP